MKTQKNKFTISGRLTGLNEYINACRENKYIANKLKKENENKVIQGIYGSFLKKGYKYPIILKITWYEPNLRRDTDNIMFGIKFIQDALVKCKILENDSQKYVKGSYHEFSVDKVNPRIEVEIIEV